MLAKKHFEEYFLNCSFGVESSVCYDRSLRSDVSAVKDRHAAPLSEAFSDKAVEFVMCATCKTSVNVIFHGARSLLVQPKCVTVRPSTAPLRFSLEDANAAQG
ncbi:hypothetical protein IscW_ISCW023276 [Ixodes scapularis]|uniref:Uncharacterized protein n=1 Tax=Ixodes scapularis TaxID=6945 RepID=B7QJW6_IXOSC|nr:hypothetical protein IscW_ISCW023276 [Ixodes scapularis]|eukprot:XP_002415473.1 hypothetical protein IscW_ISCW023276 [Ixodes scapularis]